MVSMRPSFVVRIFLSVALTLLVVPAHRAIAVDTSVAPSTVVAKQGDVSVTLQDIDVFAQTMPAEQRRGFFDNPTRLEDLITTLLLKKRLAKEARDIGLDHDPSVAAQMSIAADSALGTARMQKFKQDLKYPDFSELAREDFIGHKERYVVSPKIDVKHVLISIKTHTKEEAQALAETVRQQAAAKPGDFDALIETYSEDPSKPENHGLMKDAGSERYVRAFSDAAKLLTKPGEISPVVETPFGYHVLQFVAKTASTQPKFDDVKAQIVARLQADYTEKQVRGHTDAIRNLPIDATPALIESLRTRYTDLDAATAPAPSGAN